MPLEDDFRELLYRAVADAKQAGEHGKDEGELPVERRLDLMRARQQALEEIVLELAAQVDRLKRPTQGLSA